MNIFMADDELMSREIPKIVMGHGEHQITLAQNGDEAWAYLDDPNRHFDAVFLDIAMPETDGL